MSEFMKELSCDLCEACPKHADEAPCITCPFDDVLSKIEGGLTPAPRFIKKTTICYAIEWTGSNEEEIQEFIGSDSCGFIDNLLRFRNGTVTIEIKSPAYIIKSDNAALGCVALTEYQFKNEYMEI